MEILNLNGVSIDNNHTRQERDTPKYPFGWHGVW